MKLLLLKRLLLRLMLVRCLLCRWLLLATPLLRLRRKLLLLHLLLCTSVTGLITLMFWFRWCCADRLRVVIMDPLLPTLAMARAIPSRVAGSASPRCRRRWGVKVRICLTPRVGIALGG